MRTAIVGCGSIAHVHAKCIASMEQHSLNGFVDIRLERAEQMSAIYGGNSYSSIDELLENKEIDVIHICTPHYLHSPMIIEARKKGVHVLCEKPPVISFEQWKELKNIRGTGKLGFCFQNRFHPSIVKMREILSSGLAGKILGIRGYVTWGRSEEYYVDSDWRGRLEFEGGGALINQSIHTLDLMDQLIEEDALEVDATTFNHHLRGIIEVEDGISAYIQYPSVNACFYATNSYTGNPAPLIELHCEHMRLRMEEYDITCYYPNRVERIRTSSNDLSYGQDYWGTGHTDCIRTFYDCIENDEGFMADLDGVENAVLLTLGAYESAARGESIKIEQLRKRI